MGYRLLPRTPPLPSPRACADRLRTVFAYVEADAEKGLAFAQRLVGVFEQPPRSSVATPEQSRAEAVRLRALTGEQALELHVGDDAHVYLCFVVLAGDPDIFIGEAHEPELRALVDRCAEALDCDAKRE